MVDIRVANGPASWGVHTIPATEPCPLYTVVLDEAAATGYTGIELGPWGYMPTDPAVLGAALAARGLHLASATIQLDFSDPAAHEAGLHQARQVGALLAAIGGRSLTIVDAGAVPQYQEQAGRVRAPRLSPGERSVMAAGINRIAGYIQAELGLEVNFRNQCATAIETPEEVYLLMEQLDTELVGLSLDTGHWHYAGGDAIDAFREYGQRIRHLHLTDCEPHIRQICIDEHLDWHAANQAGVFCELGAGEVDFPQVINWLRRQRFSGWAVVCQDALLDEPDADRLSARANRDYLRKLGI